MLRNPIISNLLYKSKDVESYSSGIQRIYNECKANNVKVMFRKEKYGFTVVFYRKDFEDSNKQEIKNVPVNNGENVTTNVTTNVTIKLNNTERKIIDLIKNNPDITQNEISEKTKLTERTIKRNTIKLKEKGILERIGANKNGFWKINL